MVKRKTGFSNPEVAKKAQEKSVESWKKNGRPPRGGFSNPEVQRRATLKAIEKAREAREAKKANLSA